MLFRNFSIIEVLPAQHRQIKEKILALQPNYILNVSEEDLVASLTDEYTLDIPVLDESGIHIDYGEQKIDVSRDPMRNIRDRTRPFHIAGTRITFIIPFSGDPQLLTVQPQAFTQRLGRSNVEIRGMEIHVIYASASLDAQGAKAEFERELDQIKHNLNNLATALQRHNSELNQVIRTQLQNRKAKLLSDANMAASIGYPIKRRDGVPATYVVPVQKRRPKIERPPTPSGSFQPEPVLAMSEYNEILNIVRNMVRVMEQSPKAFEGMGEEHLRTHFLVQLNGQYEGRATGETFNFQGKTDILIREDGKNVFIAECKFWSGEKQFLETINQLLSYLSWRDTKAAVLVFNRNASFSDVLSKVEDSAKKHSSFKRFVSKDDESSFRYIFCQPDDINRELTLTVLVLNVPTQSHREALKGN